MAKKSREYSFSRFFKDLDLFGFPVKLNFDEKGSTHRTCCGGLSSIIFMAIVIAVIISQVTVLTSKSQSFYSSHEIPFDVKTKNSVLGEASLGVGTFMMVYDANGDSDQTKYTMKSVASVNLKLSVQYKSGDGDFVDAVECDESSISLTVAADEDAPTMIEQLTPMYGNMFCPSQTDARPDQLTLKVTCDTCDERLENWNIVTYMVSSKVNMANKDYPLFSFLSSTGSFQLAHTQKQFHDVSLRFNQMAIYDGAMGLGGPGGATKVNFFDTQYADQGPVMTGTNTYNSGGINNSDNSGKLLLLQTMSVSPLAQMHHKRVFTIWMMLALIGGVIFSLTQGFKWCLRPCAKHGFTLRAIKRLYLVRTKDEKMFKTSSKDSLRYQRDFNEIHEEEDWPVLSDPCCEDEAYERDHADSVVDQNFGLNQPQSKRSKQQDYAYEGGHHSGRNDRASPRFPAASTSQGSKSRNPRSNKTYLEDPTPTGPQKKDLKTKQVNGKQARKPAPTKGRGRSVKLVDNPIMAELSHEMQDEINLHRVARIYNTKAFCMMIGNFVRHIVCCDRKACDCCCDCCFNSIKHYEVMDEGQRRMDEEFDIIKLVKKIRTMQVMMNSTHVNSEKRRFKLAHTHPNVIDMVSSDDNVKTGECIHRHKNQDRKMPRLAIEGEEVVEASQTPLTMLGLEEEDEGPQFENEIEKNIDHQILNHGYPVGIPTAAPPKKPVDYKEYYSDGCEVTVPKKVYYDDGCEVPQKEVRRSQKRIKKPDQQEKLKKKQQSSNPLKYARRERGSAGEQCSYCSEDEYDDEGSYSSDRQRYYNDRNASPHGSQVSRSHSQTPQPHSAKRHNEVPIHDFTQERRHSKKPDPQSDQYQEQRKMTLPKYKQGKKFDQTQKNPHAVLSKYNRFEVEHR